MATVTRTAAIEAAVDAFLMKQIKDSIAAKLAEKAEPIAAGDISDQMAKLEHERTDIRARIALKALRRPPNLPPRDTSHANAYIQQLSGQIAAARTALTTLHETLVSVPGISDMKLEVVDVIVGYLETQEQNTQTT